MVGQFAVSLMGHDKDTLYVIVKEDSKYVYLSDGRCRSAETPKKKSRKHIQIINSSVSSEMIQKLLGGETVYPEQLRAEIGSFSKSGRTDNR